MDKLMSQMVLAAFLIGFTPVDHAEAYCWEPGKNPSFTGPPKVEQIDLRTVKVSWFGLVSMRECADQFLVKYWQKNDPQAYKMTDLLPNDDFSTDIKVVPKVEYSFQAVAREDKGSIAGIDWNKSKTTDFKTSQYNNAVKPTATDRGGSSLNDVRQDSDDKPSVTVAGAGGGHSLDTQSMSVELIAIIIVCSVVLLLIVVGLIYKVACSKKSEDSDEDEDEDDDDDIPEKEKFDA